MNSYNGNAILNKDELMHYDVLGMKWGVHRARNMQAKAAALKRQGRKEEAKNASTGKAVLSGVLHSYGNAYTAGLLSVIEPRLRK